MNVPSGHVIYYHLKIFLHCPSIDSDTHFILVVVRSFFSFVKERGNINLIEATHSNRLSRDL